MTSTPSASQWGSPAATKRALLIHGLTSSSHTWEGVAQALAGAGFLVTAPNLVGHGCRQGSDFRMSALAEDLRPYFANGTAYDVIIGHSLGGSVAVSLLPFLPPTKATSVILVDPGLELTPEQVAVKAKLFAEEVYNVRSVEAHMAENPLWTRQDAVSRVLGVRMCGSKTVGEIFTQNVPWAFSRLFATIPPHVQMTVLVSDPALSDVCRVEHIPPHPQIKTILVKGIGHWIQHDTPQVVIDTALSSVASMRTKL
ncbi:hypothetical protein HYDPIDRAFT_143951 [Hydnomerulius pinastri MD-312]|nr:hypothetical protein HYDPIDRAFT_143951 [Hydnomerulius pinastri MD-312]